MKNLLLFSLLFIIGCSYLTQDQQQTKTSTDAVADKTFFFGPGLDSTKVEVLAECDCCASDILFNKDNTFIAAYYCLEGDSFVKGKFVATDKTLTLAFEPIQVTKLYDMNDDYDSTTNQTNSNIQVVKRQIPTTTLDISFLNSKIVLLSNGKEKDYGVESKEWTKSSFISRLRKDNVLQYLRID